MSQNTRRICVLQFGCMEGTCFEAYSKQFGIMSSWFGIHELFICFTITSQRVSFISCIHSTLSRIEQPLMPVHCTTFAFRKCAQFWMQSAIHLAAFIRIVLNISTKQQRVKVNIEIFEISQNNVNRFTKRLHLMNLFIRFYRFSRKNQSTLDAINNSWKMCQAFSY